MIYVRVFKRILDSTVSTPPRLRHLFIDLMLMADAAGIIVGSNQAIANRLRVPVDDVAWALAELQKPDPHSTETAHEGRRVIPIEGINNGWLIVNLEYYSSYRLTIQAGLSKAAARQSKYRAKWRGIHRLQKEAVEAKRHLLKASGGPVVEKIEELTCSLCGECGANKIPHPVHWPGEIIPTSQFVHATCEEREQARAYHTMSPEERDAFINTLAF